MSSESSLADSDDFSMERLDDSSSEGGCKGSTCKINQRNVSNQKGGYNVSRYYLNRLKKYDKDIFFHSYILHEII